MTSDVILSVSPLQPHYLKTQVTHTPRNAQKAATCAPRWSRKHTTCLNPATMYSVARRTLVNIARPAVAAPRFQSTRCV
jgi:hypothetical protein